MDVSKSHWVLCLTPIVFGIWMGKEEALNFSGEKTEYSLLFTDQQINFRDNSNKNATALARLDLSGKIEEINGTLFLFRLQKSTLHHLGFIKTMVLFYRYYRKPTLSFSTFKSLVAAYSYPRKVRIVSFRQDEYFNIFPMDLVGDISHSNRYVFGLRHTNITLPKITATQKMVISEIPYSQKDTIYKLGSHHSKNPPHPESLPFKTLQSERFGFYIPEWAENYREINILKTINLGSHMLLWGEPGNKVVLKSPTPHLYHIHFLQYLHQQEHGFTYPLV